MLLERFHTGLVEEVLCGDVEFQPLQMGLFSRNHRRLPHRRRCIPLLQCQGCRFVLVALKQALERRPRMAVASRLHTDCDAYVVSIERYVAAQKLQAMGSRLVTLFWNLLQGIGLLPSIAR